MTADIKVKEYYSEYIAKAKTDIYLYTKKLEELQATKENIDNYLEANEDKIEQLNIKYNLQFSPRKGNMNFDNVYHNKVTKLLNTVEDAEDRQLLIQIGRYCRCINNIAEYQDKIEKANNRSEVTYTKYRQLVELYYNRVQRCLLEGFGYKFQYGLGILSINRWKSRNPNSRVNFNETRKAKLKLIAEGKKPYNESEAKAYAEKGLPYDGVKYTVYDDNKIYYQLELQNSNVFSDKSLKYYKEKNTTTYRGMSYNDIANTCKSDEDVYNLKVDLMTKVQISLIKHPENFLKFVRNAEQDRYKYRKNNR